MELAERGKMPNRTGGGTSIKRLAAVCRLMDGVGAVGRLIRGPGMLIGVGGVLGILMAPLTCQIKYTEADHMSS